MKKEIPKLNYDDLCHCWGWHTDCVCGKMDLIHRLGIVAGGWIAGSLWSPAATATRYAAFSGRRDDGPCGTRHRLLGATDKRPQTVLAESPPKTRLR